LIQNLLVQDLLNKESLFLIIKKYDTLLFSSWSVSFSMAKVLFQYVEIKESIEIAKEIKDDSYKSQALSSIAQSLIKANKIKESIEIANKIKDDSYKSQSLSSIAKSLAQSGKIEEAIEIANKIDDDKYTFYKSQALSSISKSLSLYGRVYDSTKIFDYAINIAKKVDDNSYKLKILSETISEYSQFKEKYFKDLIELIDIKTDNDLFEIASNLINTANEWWHFIVKQCIGYPEISYLVCSLIAKRYPQKTKEIADLILKYIF
jgi:tetratricopeptide (TPR) repeat protein